MKNVVTGVALVIVVSALGLLPLPARADATQIEGVTVTNADLTQLLTALHTALKPTLWGLRALSHNMADQPVSRNAQRSSQRAPGSFF